jgi:hypothetical protein
MDGYLLQLMESVKQLRTLNRRLSTFAVAAPIDPATLSSWRDESRKMRMQASAQAEKPPLLSY